MMTILATACFAGSMWCGAKCVYIAHVLPEDEDNTIGLIPFMCAVWLLVIGVVLQVLA